MSFTIRILLTILLLISMQAPAVYAQRYIQQGARFEAKADSFYTLGRFVDAEKYYAQALRLYQQQKDWTHVAEAKSHLSVIKFRFAEYPQAIALVNEGLKLLPHTPAVDSTRFRLWRFLGLYFRNTYQFDSSNHYYELAHKLLLKSKQVAKSSETIGFYNDLGEIERMAGNYKKAEVLLKKAEHNLQLDPEFNKAIIYNNIALNASLYKNNALAIQYYQKAIANLKDDYTRAYILVNFCHTLIDNKDTEEAQKQLNEAWKNYQKHRAKNQAKQDLYFEKSYEFEKASIAKNIGDYKRATDHLLKSVSLLNQFKAGGEEMSNCFKELGDVHIAQNKPQTALTYYQKALRTAHETFNNDDIYQNPPLNRILTERELFRALVGKAKAFRLLHTQTHQRRDLQAALHTNQLAIQLAEKMRRSYQSAAAKLFFTENYYAVYEEALQTANQLYATTKNIVYQDAIFNIYERSRAAVLSDITREADFKPKTIPASLLNEEQSLNQQIAGLQAALIRADSTSAVKHRTQLIDKELALDHLTRRFEQDFTAYYQLKYDTRALSRTDIQRQLPKDAALIQYFLSGQSMFTMVLTPTQTEVLIQGLDSSFFQQIVSLRNLLAHNPGSKVYNGTSLSTALYSKLITPIERLIKDKRRLIIVRDAELNYLPFEVLAKNKTDMLVKRFAISYGYSAGLLIHHPSDKKNTSRMAVAPFAGPTPPKNVFRGAPLVPLPASEEEVIKIGGDIYLKERATKKRFLEQYRNHGILHFATHALTDDRDPLRSFVAFYPDGQEYRLFTNELYDLDLSEAQLVVLSACETGVGKLQRGEGVMSLARAFTYAGARSVATTLWNANDEATAYISMHFHEYINDDLPLDEALQRAKIDFLNSEIASRYDHPYYWANLILIGQNQPVGTHDYAWWWVVGVGLVVMIGWRIWRRTTITNKTF